MTTMLAILLTPSANAGVVYTQDFNGATVGTSGSTLGDGSFIVSNTNVAKIYYDPTALWQGLQLTQDGIAGSIAAYYLPDLNPGQSINAFTASFDSMIYNAGGTTAADAWAFNFGNITNKSTAYIGAGSGLQSDGNATDVLTVSFTTYNTNQIQVWYNGNQIGGSYGTPAVFIDTFADKFRATTISWDEVNGLSLSYCGTQLITNLAIAGFNPGTGYSFGFNGWTGTHQQGVYLDNISIATTAEPQAVPEPTTLAFFTGVAGLFGFGRSLTRRPKQPKVQ